MKTIKILGRRPRYSLIPPSHNKVNIVFLVPQILHLNISKNQHAVTKNELHLQIRMIHIFLNLKLNCISWEIKSFKLQHEVHGTCSSIMEPDIDPIAQQSVFKLFHVQSSPVNCLLNFLSIYIYMKKVRPSVS